MWSRYSHALASLSKIAFSRVKFKCTKTEQQEVFDEIKQIVANSVLLDYPDYNEGFKIYIDARKSQLGALIIQKGKLKTLYSRKLTDAQKMYILTEKELLSTVETLK